MASETPSDFYNELTWHSQTEAQSLTYNTWALLPEKKSQEMKWKRNAQWVKIAKQVQCHRSQNMKELQERESRK